MEANQSYNHRTNKAMQSKLQLDPDLKAMQVKGNIDIVNYRSLIRALRVVFDNSYLRHSCGHVTHPRIPFHTDLQYHFIDYYIPFSFNRNLFWAALSGKFISFLLLFNFTLIMSFDDVGCASLYETGSTFNVMVKIYILKTSNLSIAHCG